jgi:phosphatidylinositol alpha-mannosyltransferase
MRAYPYIKQAIPDVRLIVVGAFSDKDKAPFIRYARTHGLRGIHFVGYMPPEELPRYYRTATVFCAPSTGFESFGIVLLEAMAAGVPIVASKIAGYCSVLEDGVQGLLVPPGDAQAIARAIIALVHDPTRRARMSEAGKLKATQYDWDIVARRLLDFYGELQARRAATTKQANSKRRMARVRQMLGGRA